jgi:hypothetical protein
MVELGATTTLGRTDVAQNLGHDARKCCYLLGFYYCSARPYYFRPPLVGSLDFSRMVSRFPHRGRWWLGRPNSKSAEVPTICLAAPSAETITIDFAQMGRVKWQVPSQLVRSDK